MEMIHTHSHSLTSVHHPRTLQLQAIVFFHSSRVSSSSSTMLSQSVAAISSPPSPSLFTSKSFRSRTRLGVSNLGVVRTNGNRNISISCSSSFQDQNSEGLKEKTGLEWKDIISLGSANFFNQWEKKGKKLTHKELLNCISVTRRHQRYGLALEVYEWMKNQGDRFKMSSTDTTIQLDLIFRVHGISSAEEYFLKLPESSKDNLSYGVLLNAYVQSGMREKAESLFENMRGRGYTTCSLPFSSMMTLYTKLKEYEKVMALINEMLEKNVQLDINSYDIWITVCGELGLTEKMEMVVEQVKLDSHIDPNWRKYSTMASGFIKLCQTEKAQDCLKEVENRIMDGDQMPYKSLLTLYSTIGQKEDVYRIWCTYKSSFPSSLSLVYKDMIASLVSLKDVKFTEKILEESNDPELRYVLINLLICQYVTKGLLGDAKGFADQNEGQIYSWTWETLANCCIEQKQCSNALYCVEKAATTAVGAKSWRPNPKTVTALSAACGMNVKSEDELLKVLRK